MNVTIEMVAVGKLKIADDNIRSDVGDIGELAASIKSIGVLEPLLVNTDMVVVCGARRLAASKKAGLKEVPAIVREFTEQERIETMVVENLQREDLTALEEAEAYKRLTDLGLTQQEIAAKVGTSQMTVSRRLGLLVLPEPVRKQVDSGAIKLDDANELVKLKDPKKIAAVAKKSPSAITYNVQQELAKDKREKKLASATKALVKSGEKVVEMKVDQYGYGAKLPDGAKLVQLDAGYADVVEMAPEKHAKLDCHAVAVNPNTGETVEVCTAPDTHGPTKAQKRKQQMDKDDLARAKEREQKEENVRRRRQYVATMLKGKLQQPLVLDFCHLALITDAGYWSAGYGADDMELAAILIDVDTFDADPDTLDADFARDQGEEIPDVSDLLAERAGKSATEKLRVTAAIAVAQLELLAVSARPKARDAVYPYLQLLIGLDYEPGPDEKEWMATVEEFTAGGEPTLEEDAHIDALVADAVGDGEEGE